MKWHGGVLVASLCVGVVAGMLPKEFDPFLDASNPVSFVETHEPGDLGWSDSEDDWLITEDQAPLLVNADRSGARTAFSPESSDDENEKVKNEAAVPDTRDPSAESQEVCEYESDSDDCCASLSLDVSNVCGNMFHSLNLVNKALFHPPASRGLPSNAPTSANVHWLSLRKYDNYPDWWRFIHRYPRNNNDKRDERVGRRFVLMDRGPRTEYDYVLVFFGGNAMDMEQGSKFLDEFTPLTDPRSAKDPDNTARLRLINVEYPGYGLLKEGQAPSEAGVLQVARATAAWLIRDQKVPPSKLVIVGFSMGSGPSTEVAQGLSKYQPPNGGLGGLGGLILMAPFTSIRSVASGFLPRVLVKAALAVNRFENHLKIPDVTCPTLYIHGSQDTLIPMQHSLDLMSAQTKAERTHFWPVDAGHQVAIYSVVRTMKKFIRSLWDESYLREFLLTVKIHREHFRHLPRPTERERRQLLGRFS